MRHAADTEELQQFRDMIRRFVESELQPHADEWGEAGEIPWEVHQKVGALGTWGEEAARQMGL